MLLLCAFCAAGQFAAQATPPSVSNVSASQRAGAKLVDIHYDLSYAGSGPVNISILVSSNGAATWTVPAKTFGGDYGDGVSPGLNKSVVWNAGADWNGQFTTQCRVRVIAGDAFLLIPAGAYSRGDALDGSVDAPVFMVTVSAFRLEKNLVTGELWNTIYQYALTQAYTFTNSGSSKAADHPVQVISWFDAVKWCNARSQLEGATPVYYTDAGFTTVYKSGQVAPFVKPGVNGYRLPTEAEWEKAARSGGGGKRFPWGDPVTHNEANYFSSISYAYDTSPTRGYHPAFATGATPYTSPIGSFAPNAYGLTDMAGNVFEWCWDWYAISYYTTGQTDPQGPGSGTTRVLRGGSWDGGAIYARCANRTADVPASINYSYGFRCVRGF